MAKPLRDRLLTRALTTLRNNSRAEPLGDFPALIRVRYELTPEASQHISDQNLLSLRNLGAKCLAFLREEYPYRGTDRPLYPPTDHPKLREMLVDAAGLEERVAATPLGKWHTLADRERRERRAAQLRRTVDLYDQRYPPDVDDELRAAGCLPL